MAKGTVLEVILRLRDELGGQARKALDSITQAARGTAQGAGVTARALRQVGENAREASGGLQSAGRAAGAFRSDRLTRAAQEAARITRESREARRELDAASKSGERLAGALTKAGGAGRAAMNAMRGIGQVGAGAAAGAGVAAAALRQPIAFEKRMTLMANTAYADEKDPAKRLAGRGKLVDAVHAAVREGGGTRDEAAEALDKMLASGAIKSDAAQRLLPTIQKFATASGTQSGDIADIVIRGVQNKFFREDEAALALDKALVAGQSGGFELKDMAKWLPKMLALGSGMKSMAGFEQMLAYSQAAATTAGSKDDAGNNLVNLLQKLNSQDTQKDFAKLGIDLTGTLTKAREKGKLPLEAFGDLIEQQVMGKDKRYQALKKRLGSAQGDEKQQILGDMADLASASAIGQVVQDRQALLALLAAINQKDYVKQILGDMANASGEGERSFATYKGSTAASVERAANEAEIARSNMLSDASGPLKALADGAADLAQRFPGLATVAMEATTAIGAMTAAAAAFGAMRMFSGGAGVTAAASGGWLARSASSLAGGASRSLPWLSAGVAAWDIYQTENDSTLTRAQKNVKNSETYGETGGALAGAAMGAAVGSAVPLVGTALGALLGGLAGWFSGGMAGRGVGNMLWGPSQETTEAARQLVVEDRGVIKVESVLKLDGREVARVVNDHNASEARRD
ncbi:hypothetical protein NNJEOMEG_02264 [Fundidesulfovibrio magnetotacticus]|uniref:Phage tail tape measure protein domain-containing protein n=1 Tax=Fundidesulfovibrio magnetotacticus TaxID=2730080 RepID=A0A6V8LWH0_9BACT|nr:phage tail tape measure protein [Fundidesulfovibrio magnetotacticus]GFK94419.1 hypothetical protein NNJEOMEG_02264 [Fundidesulfovibrio magnetotacticus]